MTDDEPWVKGVKAEARGNSFRQAAPAMSRHGPKIKRVPSAWKTKKGSGPSGDGVGGSSDSRELRDVRTQPPPPSPPHPEKGGALRPHAERSLSRVSSGSQAGAHAQARAVTSRHSGGGAEQGAESVAKKDRRHSGGGA